MKKTLLLVVLALAACESPQQSMSRYAATCAAYGFKNGTPEKAACMQKEASEARQANRQTLGNLQAVTSIATKL
ncbi:hypothetical protein [Paracoccus aminophilus]|uniref:Lipoprotein n=1 Tax=Paracoccus aminophilus JCM 7686 TaxID=1367847 RepID=S5XJ71_PARAH|nr:hypothetical protein [Paracoccus aminophilus]AGT07229.1 hypothetical protein JCM7686_0118 [Paracoccus aminophilus JCM 7686]